MAEQREGSPRIEDGEVNVDEELQRMQAELAKFEDEKSQVSIVDGGGVVALSARDIRRMLRLGLGLQDQLVTTGGLDGTR